MSRSITTELALIARFEQERVAAPQEGYTARKLTIEGLTGGEVASDIGKQRANANKLLFRFLRLTKLDVMIAHIEGGTHDYAIPQSASTELIINNDDLEEFEQQVVRFEALVTAEYAAVESSISVTLSDIDHPKMVIEESAAGCLVWAIAAAHDGVYRYSYSEPSRAETASNLAIVRSDEAQTVVVALIQSTTEAGITELADTLASAFELGDGEVGCSESSKTLY